MKLKKIAALVAIAATSGSAFATDGYFAHGYGMKAKGMGGAATAMASDSMGGANNPASMVWAGDRLDVGLDLFSPKRKASRTGSDSTNFGGGPGDIDFQATSGSNLHYVPEFGFNKMLGWDMSAGITVYGNGGMNTDYSGGQIPATSAACTGFKGMNVNGGVAGPWNGLCGGGQLGIDLMQLVVAPTFAMKLNKSHSLGVSLLLTHQQFKASGLHGFGGYTPGGSGQNLTNLGRDKSNGVGLRVGWMGQLSDQVTMGAAYSMKTKMSKFDLYKNLFADGGNFDIPENWNIGIAFKPNDQWTVAADYQVINYGGVPSVGNPSTNGGATIGGTLGCSTCRGFGWSNIDVLKLGAEYKYNKDLIVRAGYNHSKNPIQARDVTFNILAPGVVQDHYTLGFTYNVSKDSELTMAYMHAPKKSVTGNSLFSTWLTSGGTETIEMSQDSLGIAYGLKF
ncbi:MAG: outer membrane protein transport protein [Sulfuritalea sp.]|nr:outer membrane protein transport protein [Sulfuritalea sp.]MDP1982432.1 outer membrane protein transport protein [Sulfuritalea sp.]